MGSEITGKNNIMMCRLNKTPAGLNKTMSADFFHGTEKNCRKVCGARVCRSTEVWGRRWGKAVQERKKRE